MKYTLTRTGNRPLSFLGELESSTNTKAESGAGENRWWNIAIYRTESGKYVVYIGYNTRWQGEHERCDVYVCDTAAEAAETLRAHPWEKNITGYTRDQARQANLMGILLSCWEQGVTEVLREIGPEELS